MLTQKLHGLEYCLIEIRIKVLWAQTSYDFKAIILKAVKKPIVCFFYSKSSVCFK